MSDAGVKFSKSVERVTILNVDAATNQLRPTVVYKKKSGKKGRGSKFLKPLEKMVQYDAEARKAALESYLEGHERSKAKKSNGWLRDMGNNVFKAAKTWRKKLMDLSEDSDD